MLYFVRHGETYHNVERLLSGQCDVKLTPKGLEQAKKTALDLKDKKIDLIYSSPLYRAKTTCAEINKHHNIDVFYDNRLCERNFGKLQGMPIDTINKNEFWNYYANIKHDDGENIRDMFKRVYSFLDECDYKNNDVLIVAHMGIARILYCYFNGIPEDGSIIGKGAKNCEIVIYNNI